MLTILPVASSLNPPDQVASSVARVGDVLTARGVAHRFVAPGGESPAVLLVATGGTEHLALAAIERWADPVFLLAHPEQNSLPAALEILSRLRQTGRRGRIVMLSQHGGHDDTLRELARGLDVRSKLEACRLGRIGAPSDWLVASMPDPALVRRVWGPTVVDVPMAELVEALAAADASEAASLARATAAEAVATHEPSPGDLDGAARVALALREIVSRHRLDACAVRCFDLVMDHRTTGCLGVSCLLDAGVAAGCEGDVPATVTMLWAQVMTGEPAFMANPQDLDPATNTVWLAHCTVARRLVSSYTLRSHFESSLGVGIDGGFEPGPATVLRAGGADLRELFVSDGDIDGSEHVSRRCRTQVRVRLDQGAESLLERPVGNHHVLVQGRHAASFQAYHRLFVADSSRVV